MNLVKFLPPPPYMADNAYVRGWLAGHMINDIKAHLKEWHKSDGSGKMAQVMSGKSDVKPYDMAPGGIAVIEISGPMTKEGAPSLGVMGMSFMSEQVKQAKADSAVQKVMFKIDSGGGTVDGAFDLAANIAKLANAKPTFAYIADNGCSGAYLQASQCNAIYCNPTAKVGSIGVICGLMDDSKQAEQEGLRGVYKTTGALKGIGLPGMPVTEAQEAQLQAHADAWGQQFFAAVQRGRGFTDAQINAVSDAAVYIGAQARSMGLVDRVTSFDTAMNDLRAIKLAA